MSDSVYSWQDFAVWLIVAIALVYLWRKLGPGPRPKKTQFIPLEDLKRRPR